MRKLFILCAFLLQLLSPVYPQQATTATIEPNLKYGKPSKEELSLTSYAPDTTATAIYLFHQGQSDFIYHDGFSTNYRALGTHQNPETTRSVIRRRVRSLLLSYR